MLELVAMRAALGRCGLGMLGRDRLGRGLLGPLDHGRGGDLLRRRLLGGGRRIDEVGQLVAVGPVLDGCGLGVLGDRCRIGVLLGGRRRRGATSEGGMEGPAERVELWGLVPYSSNRSPGRLRQ